MCFQTLYTNSSYRVHGGGFRTLELQDNLLTEEVFFIQEQENHPVEILHFGPTNCNIQPTTAVYFVLFEDWARLGQFKGRGPRLGQTRGQVLKSHIQLATVKPHGSVDQQFSVVDVRIGPKINHSPLKGMPATICKDTIFLSSPKSLFFFLPPPHFLVTRLVYTKVIYTFETKSFV